MKLLKEGEISSPYDLREMLWYIIPGATLLLLIFLFEYWFAVQIRGVETSHEIKKKIIENLPLKDSIETSKMIPETARSIQIDTAKQRYLAILDTNQKMYNRLLEDVHTPIFTLLTITHTGENITGHNWAFAAIYLLLLLSVCYFLGHLSYMVGTFLYERLLIMKGYSYPYKTLLSLKDEDNKNKREVQASQGFYKGIYFWSAIIFLTMYILILSVGYSNYPLYTFIILAAIIFFIIIPTKIKFVLGFITKWKIEKRILEKQQKSLLIDIGKPERSGLLFWPIWTFILTLLMYIFNPTLEKLTTEEFFNFIWNNGYYIFAIVVITIVITEVFIRWGARSTKSANKRNIRLRNSETDKTIPYDNKDKFDREKVSYEYLFIKKYNFLGFEFDRFSNIYFHTQNSFDENFLKQYADAFRSAYGCDYEDLNRHNYWFSKMFVMENSTYLGQQINFWENTSRFTKSLSASFLIACIYCSLSFMLQHAFVRDTIEKITSESINYDYTMTILFLIPLGYYLITTLIIRYYMYIYDNRYNRLILRSFVSLILSRKNKKSVKKPEIIKSSGLT